MQHKNVLLTLKICRKSKHVNSEYTLYRLNSVKFLGCKRKIEQYLALITLNINDGFAYYCTLRVFGLYTTKYQPHDTIKGPIRIKLP